MAWENWPRLWNTDFGGLPRPEGTTSLGFTTGLFAFFVTLILAGQSSEQRNKGFRGRSLP